MGGAKRAKFGITVPPGTLFPVLALAIYWRGLTQAGVIASLVGGLAVTVILLWMTPMVQVVLLRLPEAILPMNNITILACPLTFLIAMAVSLATQNRSELDRYGTVVKARIFGGTRNG